MEEMHRIHKDVPFGYWVLWIVPAWRFLTRKRRGGKGPGAPAVGLDKLIAMR